MSEEEIQEEEQKVTEIEEKALKMGWLPEDQYKGDNWRPAEAFVERGENVIPIIRKNLANAQARAEAAERKSDAALEHMKTLQKKLHARDQKEVDEQRRAAVESGDVAAYDRIKEPEPLEEIKTENPDKILFDSWQAENGWYLNDFDKRKEALAFGEYLNASEPTLKGQAYLNKISEHVTETFNNPNRRKPSSVDSGTPKAGKKSGKGFESLPTDAKAQFASFVKQGIFTDKDKESYANDVLA